MLSVSKTMSWEMAHRIVGYKGRCANLHGHSYKVELVVSSSELNSLGMVVDFADLKKLMNSIVDQYFDHCVMLWKNDPLLPRVKGETGRIVVLDHNPTIENIAIYLFNYWDKEIEKLGYNNGLKIKEVKAWETASSSFSVSSTCSKVDAEFIGF